MKRAFMISFILILVVSHYFHYKINQVRRPFYNTVFSSSNLPLKFYKINVGDRRIIVDSLLGSPLSNYDNEVFNYSERGTSFPFNNVCTYFQIIYKNDTVVEKRIVLDD